MTYEVTWSVEVEATDHEDAALQAWGILDDTLNHRGPATVLVVRREGDATVPFDMAYDPPIALDEYKLVD